MGPKLETAVGHDGGFVFQPDDHHHPNEYHHMRRFAAPLVLVALAACDVPTSVPKWDTEWNIPSTSTWISIASLLPGSVSITPDSSAFLVSVPGISASRMVGADCPTCGTAVMPKPAFTMTVSGTSSVPSEVLTATLGNDTLVVTSTNNLSFDPLRPSAAAGSAKGWFAVVVSNGTAIVGRDSVNGATTSFAPGTALTRRIPLGGSVSSSSPITLTVTINSPQGDPVSIDPNGTISLNASAPNFQLTSADVSLATKQVNASSTSLDLTGMSADVVNRVQSGALILTIDNPVAVSGTLNVSLTTAGTSIVKPISVAAGNGTTGLSTSTRVSFTQAELRSLLGQTVDVQVAGPVTAANGRVTLTPRQVIGVTTRLDVILNTSTTGSN